MGTSELSDALNPSYVIPQRARQSLPSPSEDVSQPAPQPQPQQFTPHRSELEHAIALPQPHPPPARSRQQAPEGVQALIKLVANTHQAAEIERKRRMAWEQEQEAKYAQRQADIERQMLAMRHEIGTLRSMFSTSSQTPFGGSPALAASVPHQISAQSSTEMSPPLGPSPVSQSAVVSAYLGPPMLQQAPQMYTMQSSLEAQVQSYPSMPQAGPSNHAQYITSLTPSPSPHLQATVTNPTTHFQQTAPDAPTPHRSSTPKTKKKRKASSHSDSSSSEEDSDSSDSDAKRRPRKRRSNHHDQRCFTIHHAMRKHILQLMGILSGEKLPEGFTEDQEWHESDPIRFVWDKTPKQSVHNARMKARVIAHIKENRHQYKKVPDSDFAKKNLDTAFDQCFTTFRQKFKAQTDAAEAQHLRDREDRKSKRSRHSSRKKAKLTARADARLQIKAFEHVAFDGAFQLECISSDDSGSDNESDVLYSQGFAWRSRRLLCLYSVLDRQAAEDRATQPKRGVGKKERVVGEVKQGTYLPPKGVESWMVSRRWMSDLQATKPDLVQQVYKSIEDHPDSLAVVQSCHLLGDSSDNES